MDGHIITIFTALFLALNDVVNLGILKKLHTGAIKNFTWLGIPIFLYSLQPLIFYFGLGHTSMTALNLLWDVMSDVLVTASGLFYFKEKLSMRKYIGVLFSFIAIILLSGNDGDSK